MRRIVSSVISKHSASMQLLVAFSCYVIAWAYTQYSCQAYTT